MKFLHTADWQLGAKALQAGSRAPEIRKRRLQAVEKVVEVARNEEVDFLLLAGDTFECHDVDDAVVRETVRLLNGLAPVPVYVLPGNHDAYVPGGVWDRRSWKQVEDHVRLLTEPVEVDLPDGAVLYPCPLSQKRSSRDPTAWIPPREDDDDRLRIGLAHGALDILPGDTTNFPIAPDRAEQSGLDYLALGDWHGYVKASPCVVYSGTHEPTGYAEEDPGWVVLVELTEPGVAPVLRRERAATVDWLVLESGVRDETDVRSLEEQLGDRDDWPNRLVRLRVELLPDCGEQAAAEVMELRDELESECLVLDCQVAERAVGGHTLPEGVLARTDEVLETVLEGRIPDGAGRSVASEPEEVVSEARSLLYRLAGEVVR